MTASDSLQHCSPDVGWSVDMVSIILLINEDSSIFTLEAALSEAYLL